VTSLDVSRSEAGTLMLRGPMVPQGPGVPGGEASALQTDATGYVDTGYPCHIERGSRALTITGPPAGLINVGGYGFLQHALPGLVEQTGKDTLITALPDPYLSHRLAGRAIDRDAVQRMLAAEGANALVVNAFRNRRSQAA